MDAKKKEKLISMAKYGLTALGGLLVADGIVEESVWIEVSGGIVTIIGGTLTYLSKKGSETKLEE